MDVTDERRRPRQASFGALSAGMIARGTVPEEVLYGGLEAADAAAGDAPEAGAGIDEAARQQAAEREAWPAVVVRQDTALLQAQAEAERKRPRQSSFGSLSAGMVERGKVAAHILNAAQIELLLQPDTAELDELLSRGDPVPEDDAAAAPAADAAVADTAEAGTTVAWARSGFVFPVGTPAPEAAATTGAPPLGAEPPIAVASALYRPINRDRFDIAPADEPGVQPAAVAAKPSRWRAIWRTSLLAAAVSGWMLLGMPEPMTPVPMTTQPDLVVDTATDMSADLPTAAAELEMAPPTVADTPPPAPPPTIEAAEGADVPQAFVWQRPGAVRDEATLLAAPLPVPAPPAPPCLSARSCAGADR